MNHVSVFPKELRVALLDEPTYGWDVRITDGAGLAVYLTAEQADKLSADLWNRHIEQRAAA